ncbi:MBL fold metallo-hydrolase [Thermotoga sp. SG1]|uniref:MBL fold metallo-hydrolase n=1 Tax=Thermotoga sp. SG1 TaxID=126739 RepID=UPI000C7677D0|nr:MBL fold metallo-hydrolase [Thermotoga sp. SG1]PLV57587.1 MBL fold metallo-hydrolase [Thermotoga sp. SG1]
MNFRRYVTSSPFDVNTYVFEMNGTLYVVDPGEGISQFVTDPVVVLVTHGHCDHISGIPELQVKELFISPEDAHMLTNPEENLSLSFMDHPVVVELDWKDIDSSFKTLKVPGHTKGSRFIIFDGVVFTGDTVFSDTIGRIDLGGSEEEMRFTLSRIEEFFRNLPQEWIVCPGHGETTTVKDLLRRNPFLGRNVK